MLRQGWLKTLDKSTTGRSDSVHLWPYYLNVLDKNDRRISLRFEHGGDIFLIIIQKLFNDINDLGLEGDDYYFEYRFT